MCGAITAGQFEGCFRDIGLPSGRFYTGRAGAGRIEKVRNPLPEASSVEDGGMQKSHLRSTSLTPMIADGHWKDNFSGVGHGKSKTQSK